MLERNLRTEGPLFEGDESFYLLMVKENMLMISLLQDRLIKNGF